MEILKADIEDMFGKTHGFLPLLYDPMILTALRHGGYIAGGLPRVMLATSTIEPEYFQNGGDVDVFFRNNEDYLETVDAMKEVSLATGGLMISHAESSTGVQAQAKFALNCFVPTRVNDQNIKLKIQLVNSHFGEPEDLIRSFDLTNSMVAFDMKKGWVTAGFKRLEEHSMLEISRVTNNAEMLGARVGKYVRKYGFKHIEPESAKVLARWVTRNVEHPTCRTRSQDRYWVELNQLRYVINKVDIQDELLVDFAGVHEESILKPGANQYTGHDVYTYIDSALHVLHLRNADPKLIHAAAERAQRLKEQKRKTELLALEAQMTALGVQANMTDLLFGKIGLKNV